VQGKRCLVSGAGNVAQYCAELLLEKGAIVLSLSDSQGYVYEVRLIHLGHFGC